MVLNESSFFSLVYTVDTKSLSSLSHLMTTPVCKSFSISAFMMPFSYLLWGIFEEHVMFSNFKIIINNVDNYSVSGNFLQIRVVIS